MSLPFTLHSLADLDAFEACEWYGTQQSGFGDRFVVAVGTAIVRACRWPNTGTPAIHDANGDVLERRVATAFRTRCATRVTAEQPVVMAVYHQRRRPDVGGERLC